MRFPRWVARGVAALDYGYVLPWLARLPGGLRRPLTAFRGCINYVFDFDWRTLALGHGYVRAATHHAMSQMIGLAAPSGERGGKRPSARALSWRRYLCASREEVDCWRLHRLNYDRVPHHIEGLEGLQQAQREGRGVVLLTAHFDSLYIGLVLLAHAGVRVNLMGTRITSDPRVPPAITRHYDHKIDTLNRLLAPGRVVRFEDGMRFFVRALQQGEAVVIACDGVGTASERPNAVRFLGEHRLMASGPKFLAQQTRALVALYSCHEDRHGLFRISVSEPLALEDDGMQRAYDVLEQRLLAMPWRWWAADQMRNYVTAP